MNEPSGQVGSEDTELSFFAEAGAALGRSENAVKKLLARALLQLMRLLDAGG